jgi:hypothetical protein
MIYIGVGGSFRNIVLMNEVDINKTGLHQGYKGTMSGQKSMAYPIKQGNIMMY